MIQHKHAAVVRGWHARFLQGTVMPRAATTAATRSMHAQANISLRRQSIGTAAAAAAAAAAAEHGDSTSLIQHHHHTLAYLRLPKSAHERLSDNDSRCSGPHDNERLLREWLAAGAAALKVCLGIGEKRTSDFRHPTFLLLLFGNGSCRRLRQVGEVHCSTVQVHGKFFTVFATPFCQVFGIT